MKNYCTLFNSAYMAKGIAMLDSLERHHKHDSHQVFVLAMDDPAYAFMIRRSIGSNIRVLPMDGPLVYLFNELQSKFGYASGFWGMASWFLSGILSTANIDHITYLDSDLFFFSDPKAIFDEINGADVGIIPHRFPHWDAERLRGSGQFNVGWVTAKKSALAHMNDWADKVRARCDASTCGDQKYLDDWPEKLGDKLCVIQNRGACVAPWNVGRLETFSAGGGSLYVYDHEDERYPGDFKSRFCEELIFYHFHEYKSPESRTGYKLRDSDIELIYKPYELAIHKAEEEIANVASSI